MIHYTKGITRGCCNIISQLINHNGSDGLCNLYVYFDTDVTLGYNLTEFNGVLTTPINLSDLSVAESELLSHISATHQAGSVVMNLLSDNTLLIEVLQTDYPAGNAKIEAILFTDIVTESMLSSCVDENELREDSGFELRDGGGFELID